MASERLRGGSSPPIRECTSDNGVRVRRESVPRRIRDPSYLVGCLAVTDGPHARSPVPRVSGTKATPRLGCFDRHRAGLARARTCHPPPLPTIDPMREGSVISPVQTHRPHSSWWKTSTGSSASWILRSWSKDDRVVAGSRSSREKPTHAWPLGRPSPDRSPGLRVMGRLHGLRVVMAATCPDSWSDVHHDTVCTGSRGVSRFGAA